MEKRGRVVKVENGVAQVEMERTSTCAQCGICLQSSGDKLILYVRDSLGAHPGDEVLVSAESKHVLKVAFLTYLFPLVGLIAGYFLGRTIFGMERIGIIFAGLGFFTALFFLHQYDKRLKAPKSGETKIIQIEKIFRRSQ
jgi:sigma-E factor negative regulatory protein RseC